MKKVAFFLIALVICFGTSVMAFDSSVNLSDDINVLYYDSDSVKVKVSDELKDSNYDIYYQFIKAKEEEIVDFENKNDAAYEKFASCLDNNSQDVCINNYNLEKDNISSLVPDFGSNWNKISGNGSSIYSIPKLNDSYYLWIKAKDASGKNIYSLFYEASSLNSDVSVTGVETSTRLVYSVNELLALSSIIFSVGGLISFIISIIYIINYSSFKFKLSY